MRFAAIVSAFLGLSAFACAETITVKVAQGGNLTFTPSNVTAKEGDTIAFQFLAGNHTVTQSSFNDPCTRLTTPSLGVDSGYQPVSSNASTVPQFSFTVNNASSPLWFYCKQAAGAHCKAGMVFAVNPTANETFDAFKSKATGSNSSSSAGPSSTGSSGSVPSPSASKNPSNGAAHGFSPSELTGIITLMAVLAGSVL